MPFFLSPPALLRDGQRCHARGQARRGADSLVREMVWERLEEMGITDGLEEEMLEYGFFPEEDFYLDETGNPVFYLQPGFAEEGEALTFPLSIEEIRDEM